MASNKRQRKKSNQAARRAALEAARKRQQRKRQVFNVGGLVLGVLVLGLLLVAIAGRGGDGDGDEAASSTTAAPNTPATLASLPPVPPGRTITGDTPCPKPTGEERASSFEKAPPMCIDPAKAYRAVLTTSAGVVKVNLDTQRTPITANNFVVLARYGYYNGSSFPRTDTSIDIIQGGSPGTQTISDPGPGYDLPDEGAPFTYTEGDLTMARAQASSGAQFFFSAGPKTAALDNQGPYITFGKVFEGLDILKEVLASHVECPESGGRSAGSSCLGGAPQPPVAVQTVTIEEESR